MRIQKRDGTHTTYDEKKILQAVTAAGVTTEAAADIVAKVHKQARPPLTVTKVGDLAEMAMMEAGLYQECRRYIEYRAHRRQERTRRASITGGIHEEYKHMRPSTLKMLREANTDIGDAIANIKPDISELILSGRFIPDDIIIHEGQPAGKYNVIMPHGIIPQLDILQLASRYAIYVNWNNTPREFQEIFHAVCAYTGCDIREGRFGGMLDMTRIPITELAETTQQAADFLDCWPGAAGPGVIIPPGMDHDIIHDIMYGERPDLQPTAIWGKHDDIWGDTPYRGGCPACGGEVVHTESCSSCSCGWSACSV